jgi:hypothetical protein
MSLWPVDDEATGHLMSRFYLHLRRKNPVAAALRMAKADLMASAGFSHPYYWSGFIVSGLADRPLRRPLPWRPFAAAGLVTVLALGIWIAARRRTSPANQPE